jgi:hypothetical protein
MSTRGFSRRDLLQLGGQVVLTVGAAKIVVALPGCGGDDTSATPDAPIDAATLADAYSTYGYTLDDCHYFGTYDYVLTYPTHTYHMYLYSTYGCPYYVPYAYSGVYCYYTPGLVTGYDYTCFDGYYITTTMP